MFSRHPYSHIFLLSSWLFSSHVATAPIPIPITTHANGETSIWITAHNTLNSTAPSQERSLNRRQGFGGFGPPGGSWGPPGSSGPSGNHAFGPSSPFGPPDDPSFGPPGGPYSGNTLVPTWFPGSPESTFTTPSAAPTTSVISTTVTLTSVQPTSVAPPTSTSELFTPPASSPPTSIASTIPSTSTISSTPTISSTSVTPTSASPTSVAPSLPPTSSEAPATATSSAVPAPPPPSPTSSPPPAPTSFPAPPPTSIPPPSPTSASVSSASSTLETSTSSASSSATVSAPPAPPSPSGSPPPSTTLSAPPAPSSPSGSPPPSTGNTLQISLVNTLGSSNVHAYVTGLDSSGQVVMLSNDGSYYYPTASGSDPEEINADVAIPLNGPGETTTITLPDYISSSRVWFADGTLTFYVVETQYGPGLVEPTAMNPNDASADVNWGFVELTFKSGYGLFANLSFVDFVGLPLSIQLQTASSGTSSALGVPADGAKKVCDLLQGQAARDGMPWDELCVNDQNGNLLRVVAPPTIISQDDSAFGGYFDDYVSQIWQQFTSEQLMIDTQASEGQVACTTNGDSLTCAGDNTPYNKPNSEDIFGCNSGPFAISASDNDLHKAVVPRLCAAFNRATLHLQGGNVQPSLPPSSYYTAHPNNWYSAFVHQTQVDGRGYAFSYDDVTPNSADDVSGSVFAPDPQVLTVFVGGKTS